MSVAQPYGFACQGGLNTNLTEFELLQKPGAAITLQNFEVKPDGGYRRINGYTDYESAEGLGTRPNGDSPVLGVHPYALGVVAVVDDGIFYSEDGDSWTQINRDHTTPVVEASFTGTILTRSSQAKAMFKLLRAPLSEEEATYGELVIATGADSVGVFRIEGTGPSRTFSYYEVAPLNAGNPAGGNRIEIHEGQLVVVDQTRKHSQLFISAVRDPTDFYTAPGSSAFKVEDKIEGVKSFRDQLYIFCENSIYKLLNIEDPASTLQIIQVTNDIGCVDGHSIQEVGGDLVFLAPDGFRNIAGTERIGDVELGSVSRAIQKLVEPITSNINAYTTSSTVIRDKSQYRYFYSIDGGGVACGFIGTLSANGYQWSTLDGLEVSAIASDFDSTGEEVYYHGDYSGYIYNHDTGDSFNGATIDAKYETPYLDFGDLGTLKTIKYVQTSLSPEGSVTPALRVRYNYDATDYPQPAEYVFPVIPPPSVFGTAVFGVDIFGGTNSPMIRQTVEGSGHTVNFRISSNDIKPPYTVNGLYINYDPSGRR